MTTKRTTTLTSEPDHVEDDAPPPARRRRSASVNSVHLLGRLTADPEIHHTPSDIAVTKMRIATNEGPEPEFHDVVVWRQLAELCAEHLSKGRMVYVDGRLHSYAYYADDGSTTSRRCVEVAATSVQFVDAPRREGKGLGSVAGDAAA